MVAVAEQSTLLLDRQAFEAGVDRHGPEVAELRRRGRARFEEVGIPTTRQEDWRFTNLAPISRQTFRQASDDPGQLNADQLQPFKIPECLDLVFVNGHFNAELSETADLPKE